MHCEIARNHVFHNLRYLERILDALGTTMFLDRHFGPHEKLLTNRQNGLSGTTSAIAFGNHISVLMKRRGSMTIRPDSRVVTAILAFETASSTTYRHIRNLFRLSSSIRIAALAVVSAVPLLALRAAVLVHSYTENEDGSPCEGALNFLTMGSSPRQKWIRCSVHNISRTCLSINSVPIMTSTASRSVIMNFTH